MEQRSSDIVSTPILDMKPKVIMCKVAISKEGIEALKKVIRMAEAHISDWQFNDIDEKMAVRLAKKIVKQYAIVEKIEKVRLKEYAKEQKKSDKKE